MKTSIVWRKMLLGLAGFSTFALAATVSAQDSTSSDSMSDSSDSSAEVTPTPAPSVDTSVMTLGTEPSANAILLSTSLVTINEIESTIDLPSRARLRESEEDPTKPKAAFTQEELNKIFSDRPRFIYFPEGVDPMIIPWVREAIVAEEKAAEAAVALAAKDFDKSEKLWVEIREKHPNTKQGQEAPLRIQEVQTAREEASRPKVDTANLTRNAIEAPPEAPAIVLPQWIKENTNGILIEEGGGRVVVVQNEFLRVGDAVPAFAGVTVKSIDASEVTYSYQDRDFQLEVLGTF
ncbi:hypothetical protein GC173_18700 [bacterium]|nr:hypothetical protein [bacterium]